MMLMSSCTEPVHQAAMAMQHATSCHPSPPPRSQGTPAGRGRRRRSLGRPERSFDQLRIHRLGSRLHPSLRFRGRHHLVCSATSSPFPSSSPLFPPLLELPLDTPLDAASPATSANAVDSALGEALSSSSSSLLPTAAAVAVLALGATATAIATVSYFQMEYISASLVSRNVPASATLVVDLNVGTGKGLFYLPGGVERVVAVAADEKAAGIAKRQALDLGLELQVKPRPSSSAASASAWPAGSWAALPTGSVDAVLSSGSLAALSREELQATLKEAARILKPKRPLIFIEPLSPSTVFVSLLLALTFQSKPSIEATTLLQSLSTAEMSSLFTQVQYDQVLEWGRPHLVGVAIRTAESFPSTFAASAASAAAAAATAASTPAAAGFKKQSKRAKK